MNSNRRKWICIIGSSEHGVIAAQRCGLEVGLCADGGGLSEVAAGIPILTTRVILANMGSVREGVTRLMDSLGLPCAITSFREYGCTAAAIISEELGLPANPIEVVEAARDKAQMRRLLLGDSQLSVPFHEGDADSIRRALALGESDGEWSKSDGEWIVKPCDRSGSERVSMISDRGDLNDWYEQATESDVQRWIAEPFLAGLEFSVEAVTFAGVHHFLGVTAKETTGRAGFVEVGHCFPAPISPADRRAILDVVGRALTCLGVRSGASHTEVKLDPRRGPVLIETHTRPGGDCIPELVTIATGLSQYDLAIDSLFSQVPPPALREHSAPSAAAAIRFLTPPQGVLMGLSVVDGASLGATVRWQVEKQPLDRIEPLINSAARVGYVICRGRDAIEAADRARSAAAAFRFSVQTQRSNHGQQ